MSSTADILQRVRRVELRTSKLANDLMAGAYHSQFKGRGMDFEELREYVPGDDVRTIDWNVTAKMRRPFVKLHREERELAVMLVLDVSASGDFGSTGQTKRDFAAEVAATLAFSALRNGDKVGLLLFSDDNGGSNDDKLQLSQKCNGHSGLYQNGYSPPFGKSGRSAICATP